MLIQFINTYIYFIFAFDLFLLFICTQALSLSALTRLAQRKSDSDSMHCA